MKFRCDRDVLSEALQTVQRGVSTRPGIPALTGVLIQVISVIPTILVLFVFSLVLAVLTTFNPHVRHARPLSEVQAG